MSEFESQKIRVDLVPNTISSIAYVSQYDEKRPLEFYIYDNNAPADIPDGTTVQIRGMKPDKTGFAYECSLEENVAYIEVPAQMTAIAGDFECELVLLSGSDWDVLVGTCNFILSVEPTTLGAVRDYSATEIPAIINQFKKAFETAQKKALSVMTGYVLSGTLTAGDTAISFTDSIIEDGSLVDVYADVYGIFPTDISQSGSKLTFTFPAQKNDVVIKVKIFNDYLV